MHAEKNVTVHKATSNTEAAPAPWARKVTISVVPAGSNQNTRRTAAAQNDVTMFVYVFLWALPHKTEQCETLPMMTKGSAE